MRKQTVTSNGEGKNLQYGVRVMAILILAASVSFPANADDFHVLRIGTASQGGAYDLFATDLIAALADETESNLRMERVVTVSVIKQMEQT